MNSYSTINPQIIDIVKKYTYSVYLKFFNQFELQDLQQEFMVAALKSLESFDPKKGHILKFLNSCLYKKMKDMSRNIYSYKRVVNLCMTESKEENKTISNNGPSIETLITLDNLPSKLRKIAENLQYTHPGTFKDAASKDELHLIRKILKNSFLNRSKKLMKNISCIETLSTKELTKLSEEDLYDLTIKVEETLDWIKKIKEKFDLALTLKYQKEAKTALHNIGTDFGTCNLSKESFIVNVQIPKKVQWDQKILADIYDKFDPQMRETFFKTVFSVGEKEYSEMTDNMKKAFNPARTTNYGKIKVTIKKNERGIK